MSNHRFTYLAVTVAALALAPAAMAATPNPALPGTDATTADGPAQVTEGDQPAAPAPVHPVSPAQDALDESGPATADTAEAPVAEQQIGTPTGPEAAGDELDAPPEKLLWHGEASGDGPATQEECEARADAANKIEEAQEELANQVGMPNEAVAEALYDSLQQLKHSIITEGYERGCLLW
jgi:hypothetical protein